MAATLLQLRNRVYGYLNDLQSLTSFTGDGDRFPKFVVNSVLNDSLKHYVKVLNANYQGYLRVSVVINLIANVKRYYLGPDFRSPIYEVRRTINQVDFPVFPFQDYTIAIDTTPVPNDIYLPSYFLEQNYIVFNGYPQRDEAGAFTVYFQGKAPVLPLDGTELPDSLYDLEDCIVLKTVIRMLQGKDVSGALKSITGWKEELKEAEIAFWQQVGNRYVQHDKPIPIQYSDEFFI